MALHGESGGDAHDRRAEATRLIDMIVASAELKDCMKPREVDIVEKYSDPDEYVSVSVLFWLRDIHGRCL